ncbi:MAG TPA: 30S ribosomal protein S20 [Candidatus Portnoybacteria bacterium]|nr:30S ribosomal protein S20 [Candidatus Portnoybacteria bacterium]
MPNLTSAKKALRQNRKKRVLNLRRLRVMRQAIKDFKKTVERNERENAQKLVANLYKVIDKAAKRGVIKKNTAARKKSRLMKLLAKG